MKKLFTKLTITLMAAGTLYATSATASADTTAATPEPTSTALVNRVNRETNLATKVSQPSAKDDLTPHATKTALKTMQTEVLNTVDTSSQSLDKMKYQPTAK